MSPVRKQRGKENTGQPGTPEHKMTDDDPVPEEGSARLNRLCLPMATTRRPRAYLMMWLATTLCADFGEALTDAEWEVLDRIRARMRHVVEPILPFELRSRVELLGKAHPGYEHTYTITGPYIDWFATPRDTPDAQPIPFHRGKHPASAAASHGTAK
jgi:hypothetical protein